MTIEQIKQFANLGYSDYEIREELERNKKEYPKKPLTPTLKAKHTPEDVIEYAEELKQWNIDIEEYEIKWKEADAHNDTLDSLFEQYLEEKSGILDFNEAIQQSIRRFCYEEFSTGDGNIAHYQNIKAIVDFINEIKKNYDTRTKI